MHSFFKESRKVGQYRNRSIVLRLIIFLSTCLKIDITLASFSELGTNSVSLSWLRLIESVNREPVAYIGDFLANNQ